MVNLAPAEPSWKAELEALKSGPHFTVRGSAVHFGHAHEGIDEEPHGSNYDKRPHGGDGRWGIAKAQFACAGQAHWLDHTPWCGEWCFWILKHASVHGLSSRLASVALIEDDARARRGPFSRWLPRSQWHSVLRGDLAVMFGRGVHVEMVLHFVEHDGQIYVVTDGGNTSRPGGNQSEGIGSYRKVRHLSDVYGFACVDFGRPGPGRLATIPDDEDVDREIMQTEAGEFEFQARLVDVSPPQPSDEILIRALRPRTDTRAIALAANVEAALKLTE
jgi:hypothetical protein